MLIIVQNLTVPLDRRVWQEATALKEAGYTVSVVCPVGGQYTDREEQLEGIHIYRHPLPYEADGALGYLIEYSVSLFWEFLLALKAFRRHRFEILHACNPPDLIFLIALIFKWSAGVKFLFDHHDINPELYEAKFGRRGLFHRLLLFFERLTFRSADVSIATNGTFAEIAVRRGGMRPDNVFVVRSVPDLTKFVRTEPDPALRNSRPHVVGYIGVIGKQDGVDILIAAMLHLVKVRAREDIQCVVVGDGTEVPQLKKQAARLGLTDYITFTGFLSGEQLLSALSSFEVGVIPDPKNVYNDKISMNKVFEYMSLSIPFVQFDLIEGKALAQTAALYACDNSAVSLAAEILRLLDDKELAERQIEIGKRVLRESISWDAEKANLLRAYARLGV